MCGGDEMADKITLNIKGMTCSSCAMNVENILKKQDGVDHVQKDDIHNGDLFINLDYNGKLIEDSRQFWTASHSSTIQTKAFPGGDFYTMTIGDAHPYGLQVYNRSIDKSWIVWFIIVIIC